MYKESGKNGRELDALVNNSTLLWEEDSKLRKLKSTTCFFRKYRRCSMSSTVHSANGCGWKLFKIWPKNIRMNITLLVQGFYLIKLPFCQQSMFHRFLLYFIYEVNKKKETLIFIYLFYVYLFFLRLIQDMRTNKLNSQK